MRKIATVFFTKQAALLGMRIRDNFIMDQVSLYTTKEELAADEPSTCLIKGSLKDWCGQMFQEADAILFISASGIAVRTIAPFVASKVSDPAVLVADELGQHVISLMSGHLGGGNALTREIAACIGSDPVITTASDVNGKTAIDVWAKDNDLVITDLKKAKCVAADVVAGKQVPLYCEGEIQGAVPSEFCLVTDPEKLPEDQWCVAVSVRTGWGEKVLHLIPKATMLGIGCRKDREYAGIRAQLTRVLAETKVAEGSIYAMASIDLKAQEPGLLQLKEELEVPFITFTPEELMAVPGTYEGSAFVQKTTGVDNVCERSAMAGVLKYSDDAKGYLSRKVGEHAVTIALLEKNWRVSF